MDAVPRGRWRWSSLGRHDYATWPGLTGLHAQIRHPAVIWTDVTLPRAAIGHKAFSRQAPRHVASCPPEGQIRATLT